MSLGYAKISSQIWTIYTQCCVPGYKKRTRIKTFNEESRYFDRGRTLVELEMQMSLSLLFLLLLNSLIVILMSMTMFLLKKETAVL